MCHGNLFVYFKGNPLLLRDCSFVFVLTVRYRPPLSSEWWFYFFFAKLGQSKSSRTSKNFKNLRLNGSFLDSHHQKSNMSKWCHHDYCVLEERCQDFKLFFFAKVIAFSSEISSLWPAWNASFKIFLFPQNLYWNSFFLLLNWIKFYHQTLKDQIWNFLNWILEKTFWFNNWRLATEWLFAQ